MLVADLGATHSRLAVCDLEATPLAEACRDLDIADGPDNQVLTNDITLSPDGDWLSIRKAGQPGYIDLYRTTGGTASRMGPSVANGEIGPVNGTIWTPNGSHFLYIVCAAMIARVNSLSNIENKPTVMVTS